MLQNITVTNKKIALCNSNYLKRRKYEDKNKDHFKFYGNRNLLFKLLLIIPSVIHHSCTFHISFFIHTFLTNAFLLQRIASYIQISYVFDVGF